MAAPPSYASISASNDEAPPPLFVAEPPPAYDWSSEGASTTIPFRPSPNIDTPLQETAFKIGRFSVTPFVRPSDLQAHLVLLGAFHRLQEEVRTQKGKADIELQPDELWTVFVQRAVHRFEAWVTRVIDSQASITLAFEHVPPLDVMMVWHTYMLNPRNYYEDSLRLHKGLLELGSMPLAQIPSTIDQETLLSRPPIERRVAAFSALTGLPFEPPLRTTADDVVSVLCPQCSQPASVPWITFKGDGYAQRDFNATCGVCRCKFDREALCVRKFCNDVEKCTVDTETTHLANILVDYHQGIPLEDLARELTDLVLEPQNTPIRRAEDLGKSLGWKFAAVELYCRRRYMNKREATGQATPRSLRLILSAYRQPGPFSIDLESAVMRQASFIQKMVDFGWTEFGRFDQDNGTLTRSVFRYHAFLDLTQATPGRFVVPTLDIDLAWHTHQLLCTSYRQLHRIMLMVPDHDDKVTQSTLGVAYDDTSEAWKERFKVPYSVCGCIPPAKADGGVSGLFSRMTLKGKSKATASRPIENARPDLVSQQDAAADETHPSEHNSVAIMNPREGNAAKEQTRQKELEKRAKDLSKKVEKSGASDWAPIAYGSRKPFGNYGQGDCAVYSGRGLKGEFEAGECVRGNGQAGLCATGTRASHPRPDLLQSIQISKAMRGELGIPDNLKTTYGFMVGMGMDTGNTFGGLV